MADGVTSCYPNSRNPPQTKEMPVTIIMSKENNAQKPKLSDLLERIDKDLEWLDTELDKAKQFRVR